MKDSYCGTPCTSIEDKVLPIHATDTMGEGMKRFLVSKSFQVSSLGRHHKDLLQTKFYGREKTSCFWCMWM